MKKVIWSLFDSETAITQQLNSEDYIVYSIGLPSSSAITDNFIKIDLSKKSCLKKLEKLPKPNIIFASPPCESWVTVSVGVCRFFKRNFNEHNLYWQKNFKPNNYMVKHRNIRLLGQKTAFYTAEIIKKFNPELWCIENGSTSLIFKYLNKYHNMTGYKNMINYDSYNSIDFSKKPTYFFSNKKMILKKNLNKVNNNRVGTNKNMRDKVRTTNEWIGFNSPTAYLNHKFNVKESYCERSRVPIELYKHILSIYENKEQLTMELI
jgi:hypothetical protein